MKARYVANCDGRCIPQEWTIDFWLRAGTPKEKLIVGIPTYGMSFTLEDPANHDMKAAATGGGKRGKYTQEEGTLAYCEVWYTLVGPTYFKFLRC